MANPDWVRDEVILALDVYLNDKNTAGNKLHPEVIKLSEFLKKLPLFSKEERDDTFRNINGVGMKLSNFLRIDPNYKGKGLERGNKLEEEVWNEFYSDRERLKQTVQKIREFYKDAEVINQAAHFSEDIAEAPEGRILTVLHRIRERSKILVSKKKKQALAKFGKIECEACGFDFSKFYGHIGYGFIECHHDKPVSSLSENSKTTLDDLRLVCSNCHSIIHRSRPWISIEALRDKITEYSKGISK